MNDISLPAGLWPVMLTPFRDNNELDLPGLERLTEFYLEKGSNGLFANCLSSEMFQLTEGERLQVIETVLKTTAGRVPVVATGSFGADLDTNADFIKRVYDLGVAAVIISSNQLVDAQASEGEFQQQLEALVDKTDGIPLGIYECPVPYKRLLSSELVGWMAQSGRFVYHKDTSCDSTQIQQKLEAIQGSSLGLFNANIPTGLTSLQQGARGLSPIGANFFPELYSYLCRHYADPDKAESIQKLNALLSVIDPLVHMNYPLSAKLFLQKRGLAIGATTRTSVHSLSGQELIRLDDLMTIFRNTLEELTLSVRV
ncbi:4-hydroxy-tetrahydrodipicolinate synthase [Catalinimonas alkaloidigena]|uniref:4-hydroxy-tetrahydrodipicolinate synthase n=1 Tax=Catalinimonas alkaloidigena TaxID=1075417 RepID=A0A1G9QH64_9BACT|nr:dihydrodipicolinate synthase family protein [Catalinimonas alkaloidigena]SDM10091.1 4-hydroxy-tetrahydrodipicolinate synthase [Catalinimonas alkaloidigena]